MKALGYFRTGADSPPTSEQEEAFLDFCRKHGYEAMASFTDVESPETDSRHGYRRMLDLIRREGGTLSVVVPSLSSLGSPVESASCILELEGLGAKLILADDETADPLSVSIGEWSGYRDHEDLGNRVKAAMRSKAMRGEVLGKPPFGYRIGPDRKFEIVPEEAETVELIYRLYLEENMGIRLIARYLNERGITTRRGGRWSMVSIRDILRNRTYLGIYHRFGTLVLGNHPAIIPPDVFGEVQERLIARGKPGERGDAMPFLLSGLLHCGYCGNRMIGVNRRQSWRRTRDGEETHARYRYYQCQSRTNQSFCAYHTWRADELEGMVVADLRGRNAPDVLSQPIPEHEPGDRASGDSRLKARLRALDRRFQGYLEQAARGDITLQQLRTEGGEIVRERKDLERRLSSPGAGARRQAATAARRKHVLSLLNRIENRWDALPFADRRSLLEELVERVVVYDDHIETVLRV